MYRYYVSSLDKVVDGDTIHLTLDLGFYTFFKVKLRIIDLDTPELNDKSEAIRLQAETCKAYAMMILKDKDVKDMIVTTTGKPDKYGRWLGDIIIDNKDGTTSSFRRKMLDFVATV
jgi:micrococcal nuclease